MMSEAAYRTADRAKSTGRWLVWHPLRLVGILALVLVVWVAVSQLTKEDAPAPSPSATATQDGLPPQWQTWPTAEAKPPQ